jgi:NAD(P)-dependent dehydrogenase (short-subunit alcohol dehydrogenase family)
MRDVEGKVAFITGGASGIGFGMARAFLHNGMKVVLADVQQDHLDNAASILGGSNRPYHLIKVDVTDREAMARAADETERVFGKVHVVCNNAGVGSKVLSIDEASYEDWDWMMGINLGGVINGVVTFVSRIKAHGEGGHIVNTSSMAGLLPLPPPGGIYTTSKFAVRGLTESLRLALGPHRIGASVLFPGLVRTNLRNTTEALYPTTAEHPPVPENPGVPSPSNAGMDPLEVGERVLLGIQRNDAYILPHGEFRDEVAELSEAVLAGFPALQPMDPGREAFEEQRRRATAAARKIADSI